MSSPTRGRPLTPLSPSPSAPSLTPAAAAAPTLTDRLMFFAAVASGNLPVVTDMLTPKEVAVEEPVKWTLASTVTRPRRPQSPAKPQLRAKIPDVNSCVDPVRAWVGWLLTQRRRFARGWLSCSAGGPGGGRCKIVRRTCEHTTQTSTSTRNLTVLLIYTQFANRCVRLQSLCAHRRR